MPGMASQDKTSQIKEADRTGKRPARSARSGVRGEGVVAAEGYRAARVSPT